MADTAPSRPTGETVLFWGLLALHLLLIWAFPFVPTQDGPGHQALTAILRHYNDPGADLLRRYYLPNREALPNWFIFFLMGKALGFLSVPAAEKALLTAYVLLLPLAARYALRAIDPRAGFLAVLAFPFVYNYTFQMGFFNFCFSLAAYLFTVGWWLKHADRMGPARTALLALLVLWVYFCHPVTLVVTVAALGTLAAWRAVLEIRERRSPPVRIALRRLAPPVLASLPALLLMASFVGARMGAEVKMMPLWVKVKHLSGLYTLASVFHPTYLLAMALALLFYFLAFLCLRVRRGQPLQLSDGLLLAVAVLAVAFFAAPSDLSGGGFINHRLVLFPFLTLMLWIGAFEHPARRRLWTQGAAAGIAVAFLGLFAWKYAAVDRGLSEILAAGERIEPDHTFLFLSYAHAGQDENGNPGVFRTWPFVHAGGYIAARKRLVDLSLYEANEDYFPLYYRPELNPYRYLAAQYLGIETEPPSVDLFSYPQRTGGSVDYVMLWGLRRELLDDPKVKAVLGQLAAGYEEIHASADGRVRLFRLRAR